MIMLCCKRILTLHRSMTDDTLYSRTLATSNSISDLISAAIFHFNAYFNQLGELQIRRYLLENSSKALHHPNSRVCAYSKIRVVTTQPYSHE